MCYNHRHDKKVPDKRRGGDVRGMGVRDAGSSGFISVSLGAFFGVGEP